MTTIRQFNHIALALLSMTGRVTMLGISRWTGAGGSYRTVQRFFATVVPWANLLWLLLHPPQLANPRKRYSCTVLFRRAVCLF
jgi:hypothetical protein